MSTIPNISSSVASAVTLSTASSLPSNSLLQAMASMPVMSTAPTFASRVVGLNTATEAANSTIVGSTRVAPNYTSPRIDANYRISGAFSHLNGNAGIDCGAVQSTRADGIIGPTGMVGTYSFEFIGQNFEWWGRDTTGTQYFTMWVSKNGGPFQAHVAPDTAQSLAPLTAPNVGTYFLQPVDMGSRATWRIIIEAEAFTFGGIRYNASTDTLRYPSWSTQRLLVLSDSYGVGGGGYRSASDYPIKLARLLGMDLHLTGYGGTGWSATNGDNTKYFNFAGRIPAEVSPFFSVNDQPAVVLLQGSINDSLFPTEASPYAGTTQLNTDADALITAVQTAYPNALIVATHPMHPYRGDATQNSNDATLGGQIDTAMSNHGLSVPYDAVTSIPLNSGNSALYSAVDNLHPSPAGSSAIATGIYGYIKNQALTPRTFTGTPNLASAPMVTSALSQASAASLAASAATAPYNLLRDMGMIELTGLSTGVNYVAVPGAPGSAMVASAAGSARGLMLLNSAYYSVTGKTLYVRLRCQTFGNATNPGCTFSVSLVLAGALSGAASPGVAIGAAPTSPVVATLTPSGINSKTLSSSGDVVFPSSATYYLLQVSCSANMAAGSYIELNPSLEYHNV